MNKSQAEKYIGMIKTMISQDAADEGGCFNSEWIELLKDVLPIIEDAAKGLLVKLPVAVGDTAYGYDTDDGTVWSFKICGVAVKEDGVYLIDDNGNMDIVGSQFAMLTRESAEAALKENGG